MMIYLLFFRMAGLIGLPSPGGHTNMIQMILTLKIIGFAFEKNAVLTKAKDASANLTDSEKEILSSSMLDIFHYCFNYIGLLTGPYYTYRTFYDYFNYPFSKSADCLKATLQRLTWVPLYAVLFLSTSYIWPSDYMNTTEFYESRSVLYRLFYVWPTFFIFRMRIYIGITLSECICIMAGLGCYPKILEADKSGHGPTKPITQEVLDSADTLDYEFKTVENIDVPNTESCITFREGMKHWNKCVQYWLAMYIYKRFPNKKFRIMATMAVSAYWHGILPGHYFCILGPIVYLPVEDMYLKVFKSDNPDIQRIINRVTWIFKFFAFSYLGTAFVLRDVGKIWHFYSSVYHFGYFFWLALYIVSFIAYMVKKSFRKKAVKEADKKEK